MLLIGLLALGLRAWHLGSVPWVLAGDQASAGLSGINFIKGTQNNIFGMGWYSFPALYFLAPATSIKLFGQTIAAPQFPIRLGGRPDRPPALLLAGRSSAAGLLSYAASTSWHSISTFISVALG